MLSIYTLSGVSLQARDGNSAARPAAAGAGQQAGQSANVGAPIGPADIWIDLNAPTKEEEALVEAALGIEIPTRDEMREIEVSNRLYMEGGAHYMTAVIVYRVETPEPAGTEITFILTDTTLVTVRYAEPLGFQIMASRAAKAVTPCSTPVDVMISLLEALVEREADLIERMQATADRLATTVFDVKGGAGTRTRRLDVVLQEIGKVGEINSRVRDSLLSIARVLTYLGNLAPARMTDGARDRIQTELQDVHALSDHLGFLSSRLTFMLDAALGMVGIEQNQIIKLFSVVAVMLMPPTLVASIYGMNFKHMPELGWPWGYPMALCLMVISAVVPYFYFKQRGWL